MCYHHSDPYIFNFLTLILISLFAYIFITYAKGNPAKHHKWKNQTIKTKLTSDEFVSITQNICLHKNYLLMDISPTHAFIKQNPTGFHWGAYYYIELNNEPVTTITVWCRGGLYKSSFRLVWLSEIVNLFYKV
jgi:hypothetical protein